MKYKKEIEDSAKAILKLLKSDNYEEIKKCINRLYKVKMKINRE